MAGDNIMGSIRSVRRKLFPRKVSFSVSAKMNPRINSIETAAKTNRLVVRMAVTNRMSENTVSKLSPPMNCQSPLLNSALEKLRTILYSKGKIFRAIRRNNAGKINAYLSLWACFSLGLVRWHVSFTIFSTPHPSGSSHASLQWH